MAAGPHGQSMQISTLDKHNCLLYKPLRLFTSKLWDWYSPVDVENRTKKRTSSSMQTRTRLLKITSDAESGSAAQEGGEVLARGGLVIFPTETVYGVAANAELPAALDRLRKFKQRPANKPFTLHIGKKSDLHRYVPQLSPLNQQFLRKAWPGPLTVIFSLNISQIEIVRAELPPNQIQALYLDHTIGVRLPDHRTAQKLLNAVEAPIVAPSANLAGNNPPVTAQEAMAELDGKVDLALDFGPTKYKKASTVVRIEDERMEVLRPGVLDEGALERMRQLHFLFVCTGNTCRSPMAEGFCRSLLAERLRCPVDQLEKKRYMVVSAGLMATYGASASPEAEQVCSDAAIDITDHRSRRLTLDLINQADYVFTMGRAHTEAVQKMAPQAAGRTLGLDGDGDIDDPIGMTIDCYRACARRIEQALRKRLQEMFP